ncbi:hypothetical protein Gotri_024498, partial [Gossypium trilobum]|nr:hypothetical protein [Gossypium trilobum]
GFGHIQSECVNTIKKKQKSLVGSDEEFCDFSNSDEYLINYTTFTATTPIHVPIDCETDKDLDHDVEPYDSIKDVCYEMIKKIKMACQINDSLGEEIINLKRENARLEKAVQESDFDIPIWGAYDGPLKAWQLGAAWIVLELMPGAAVHNALAREIQSLLRR